MECRFCKNKDLQEIIDLGFAPPSNAYIDKNKINYPETSYPLKVNICKSCYLAQTEDYTKAEELFTPNYAYFSSNSKTLLKHAEEYVNLIKKELALDKDSFVIEIASNDGYLLKNFVKKHPLFRY